jgi:hypothetical protein
MAEREYFSALESYEILPFAEHDEPGGHYVK